MLRNLFQRALRLLGVALGQRGPASGFSAIVELCAIAGESAMYALGAIRSAKTSAQVLEELRESFSRKSSERTTPHKASFEEMPAVTVVIQ